MDEADEGRDEFDFVCLEVSDEVPGNVLGKLFMFGHKLLDFIFTKYPLAAGVGFQDRFNRLRFGNRDQRTAVRYIFCNLQQILFNIHAFPKPFYAI
jgi:hypothetical protein